MSDLRILIAESHRICRIGMRTVLTNVPGWTVCAETDAGPDTIQGACALAPDVVVLSLDVPLPDRIAVAKQIRAAAPSTEILLLATRASFQFVADGRRVDARALILKSDVEATLVEAVAAAARHEQYLSQSLSAYNGNDGLTELLSPRELAVARLVASGHGNKEVAGLLGITVKTAETYRTRAMRKLGAHSVVDLVLEAVRLGLIDVDTGKLVAPEL